jgi:protein ImuA
VQPQPAIEFLRAQVEKIDGRSRRARSVLPFGIAELDSRLPGGGLAKGALHEVAGGGNGAIDGAAAALFSAGIAARAKGKVLWCITRPNLFAPALAQAGLSQRQIGGNGTWRRTATGAESQSPASCRIRVCKPAAPFGKKKCWSCR